MSASTAHSRDLLRLPGLETWPWHFLQASVALPVKLPLFILLIICCKIHAPLVCNSGVQVVNRPDVLEIRQQLRDQCVTDFC
jgi:hypothetical protein